MQWCFLKSVIYSITVLILLKATVMAGTIQLIAMNNQFSGSKQSHLAITLSWLFSDPSSMSSAFYKSSPSVFILILKIQHVYKLFPSVAIQKRWSKQSPKACSRPAAWSKWFWAQGRGGWDRADTRLQGCSRGTWNFRREWRVLGSIWRRMRQKWNLSLLPTIHVLSHQSCSIGYTVL